MGKKKGTTSKEVQIQREKEFNELIYQFEDILTTTQYSKYHYRVFKGNRSIDVWPRSKKFWATWMIGSKVYGQVTEILVEFTKAPKTK